MVSQRGIEANPDKIRAIMEMKPPRNVKEVQSLNGKVAALNRFVSRATDNCLPFFCTLKKSFGRMPAGVRRIAGLSLCPTVAKSITAR